MSMAVKYVRTVHHNMYGECMFRKTPRNMHKYTYTKHYCYYICVVTKRIYLEINITFKFCCVLIITYLTKSSADCNDGDIIPLQNDDKENNNHYFSTPALWNKLLFFFGQYSYIMYVYAVYTECLGMFKNDYNW